MIEALNAYVHSHTFYAGFVIFGLCGLYNLLRGRFITASLLLWSAAQYVFPLAS